MTNTCCFPPVESDHVITVMNFSVCFVRTQRWKGRDDVTTAGNV